MFLKWQMLPKVVVDSSAVISGRWVFFWQSFYDTKHRGSTNFYHVDLNGGVHINIRISTANKLLLIICSNIFMSDQEPLVFNDKIP